LALLVSAVFIAACAGCQSGAMVVQSTESYQPGTGFTRHEVMVDGQSHAVWVFVPKDYNPAQRYPTILFLHGLFEAGSGYNSPVSAGLGPVIAKDPDKWQFITIFPQSDSTWRGDEHDKIAIAALDFTEANWSVDRDRVILAGLSFGGLGTWEIGAKHSDRFAALVPVSGISATEQIQNLVLLPVWAFAYRGDPWVRPQSSEEMCKGITGHGGQARLTEFDGVGHDCWDKAVAQSQLVPWMLQQRRRPIAQTSVPRTAVANNSRVADAR
jgi:predicted peptidase